MTGPASENTAEVTDPEIAANSSRQEAVQCTRKSRAFRNILTEHWEAHSTKSNPKSQVMQGVEEKEVGAGKVKRRQREYSILARRCMKPTPQGAVITPKGWDPADR